MLHFLAMAIARYHAMGLEVAWHHWKDVPTVLSGASSDLGKFFRILQLSSGEEICDDMRELLVGMRRTARKTQRYVLLLIEGDDGAGKGDRVDMFEDFISGKSASYRYRVLEVVDDGESKEE
jgi:hypothetical protein